MDPPALLRALFARRLAALPADDVAWRELVARAGDLGALGLLHAAVRRAGATAAAPPDVRDALRRAHAANAAKNLELEREARRVLEALGSAGVRAAPMKGAALFRESVVRDLGTRPTTDVDLATRRRDRDVALRVLRELGYAERSGHASWKHLPPMRRGDLAIELHEIAYWSGDDRRIFGADHLDVADRSLRLARLWALQVHHLVLGSPPDASLLVRTIADLACFARVASAEPDVGRRAADACGEAGVAVEAAALDVIASDATGEPRALPDLVAPGSVVSDLLEPLARDGEGDRRVDTLAHFLRTVHRQPLRVSAATLRVLLRADVDAPAARRGEAPLAAARRAIALASRVGAALPAALRRARRR